MVTALMAVLAGLALGAELTGHPGTTFTAVLNESPTATKLSAEILPGGATGLSYSIEYAPEDSNFCQSEGSNGDDDESTPVTAAPNHDTIVSVVLSDLTPGAIYCAEVIVFQGSSVATSSGHNFPLQAWTAGTPEITIGEIATLAGPTSDRIDAAVDPAGAPVTYRFEWAPRFSRWCESQGASGTARTMPATGLAAGDAYDQITGTLTGLAPGRAYCAGVTATNATGSTTVLTGGETNSGFMGGSPSVATGPATDISRDSARLGYRVDADFDPSAEIYVQWRPSARGRHCTRATLNGAAATYQYTDAGLKASGREQTGSLSTGHFASTDPDVRLAPRTRYCYMAVLASDEPNPFEQNDYDGAIRYFTTR